MFTAKVLHTDESRVTGTGIYSSFDSISPTASTVVLELVHCFRYCLIRSHILPA
jgi:hypothetical protein